MPEPVKLSTRLETVAGFVLPGRPLADVGTDHARLPAALVQRGVVPNAVASDRLPGPLAAARRTVTTAGVASQVQLRECDGLEGIEPGDVGTVVIAGMGGAKIIEILTPHSLTGVDRLVLQPNGGAPRLRRYLNQRSFDLVDEALMEEGGHIYTIVIAEPAKVATALSYEDAELGPCLRRRGGPVFRAWAHEQADRDRRAIEGQKGASKPDPEALARVQRRFRCLLAALT